MKNKQLNQSVIQIIFLIAISIFTTTCAVSKSNGSTKLITRSECEVDKSFAFIPGGEFISGSDRQERDFAYRISAEAIANESQSVAQAEQKLRKTGWFDRESNLQTSSLPDFCLSRNLVTNQEYQEFILATNRRPPGISKAGYQKQRFLVHPYDKVEEFLWQDNEYPEGTGQNPVVLVSYDDARAYARWKSQKTGDNYRLPTALEWEKAARGGDGNYFPWGNEWQAKGTNSAVSGLDYTSKIGQFPLSKSVYGIEDMAGNVFEYTSTLKWQKTRSVMKGCSWDDLPGFCRGAYEHTRLIRSRHILFGFRLVKQ